MSKTITDIIPPSRRTGFEGGASAYSTPQRAETIRRDTPPEPGYGRSKPPKKSFPYGTALVVLVVVAISIVLLMVFSNATVTITPTTTTATLSDTYTATFGTGDLAYELVNVTKTVSAAVPSESTQTVNDPSRGPIVISNTQPKVQTLIKNTRFESADGHIFRIHDSVVVPAGSTGAPGTITATAYADLGGDSNNIPATTFTVPGLKGSTAFTMVTAKSNAAMTGGFSGTRATVSQTTRDAQNEKNKLALTESLKNAAAEKLEAGYVIISGSTFTSYSAQPDTEGKDGTVNINLQGTMTAVSLSNAALAKALAYKASAAYTGQPITILNPSKLTITPSDGLTVPDGQQPFTFSLQGPVTLLWSIDTKKIAGAVAGKTRTSAQAVVKSFPEVANAALQVRPFWTQTFPQDPSRITVSTTPLEEVK